MKSISGILFLTLLTVIFFTSCKKKESVNNIQNEAIDSTAISYPLDLNNSKLFWLAKKVTGQHNGTVNIISGDLLVNKNTITGGKFEIDLSSITVSDLTDQEMNVKLTKHLKSVDFFNVDSFPTATFVITSIKADSNNHNRFVINGNLTIKSITNNISFPVDVITGDDMINAKATIRIDRTLWNIRYKSNKFFPNLGDKMIYDEFEVSIDILAKKGS